MTAALDWLTRVVMLVLAGLVSLSIIGAIAAIPSGSIDMTLGPDAPYVRPAAEDDLRAPPVANPAMEGEGRSEQGTVAGGLPSAMVPAAPSDPQNWLESIAYALIALVGILAFVALVLWRSLHEQRRIADALDRLDRGP